MEESPGKGMPQKGSHFLSQESKQAFWHYALYIFFGGCTTLLNLVLFLMLFRLAHWSGWLSNAVAWWPSVVFAWWTNRLWVFHAVHGLGWGALALELFNFTASRFFTGVVDVFLIWVTVDLLAWNDLLMKIAVGILIVVLNYVLSRWWIFKKAKEEA